MTGWSPRMLRYLEGSRARRPAPEQPPDTALYGLLELNQLRSLARSSATLRRGARPTSPSQLGSTASPSCAARRRQRGWQATDGCLPCDWEQRKHERLLAA